MAVAHALPHELVSMLDAMPGPRILVDPEFRILAANQAYRLLYGAGDGLIGRTCHEVSHRFDKPCDQCGESCPRTEATLTGHASRVLHLHYTPHGREYVDVELIPVRGSDHGIRYYIESMTQLRTLYGEKPLTDMVGVSTAFHHMLAQIHRVAGHDTSVLLLGESGTGKELAAQTVHNLSPRAGRPFVPVDCSGMTESLFESEMFGHEKGAFTGATHPKPGLVEAAEGGTLFLDELGDIPLSLQIKLLRLIESGSYRRVGGIDTLRADFRLVAATHRDLPAMVAAGTFRRDLYYRLSVFPINLPPLRERLEDLPTLCADILRRLSPDKVVPVSPEAMAVLARHDFPGNVRELRNLLERARILSEGHAIQPGHLPDELLTRTKPTPASLAEVERRYLREQLARVGGDKHALARQMGLSRRTIDRKLRADPD